MPFQPSVHQQRLFDFVERGRGSAVVIAVAGAGKSTSVVRCLPLLPETASVALLAFNTDAAKDLTTKIEQLRRETGLPLANVRASTFHSLAFGAVAKRLRSRGVAAVKPHAGKLRDLLRELPAGDVEVYGDFIVKLVGLARGEGIGVLTPNLPGAWFDLIRHHDLYLDDEHASEERAVQLARDLLKLSNAAAERGDVDFDDMLYQVLNWKLRLWQHDVVFCDEAQDTNPVRRALLRLALRPSGRLIAVGDPRQAIYGFTGASHDAIERIKAEFSAVELPLTVSYRCARRIVEHARDLVPYLEAHDAAPEGAVETLKLADALRTLTAADAILCRKTNPLLVTAYRLIARGTGCRVLGREIGAGLVTLVRKLRARGIDQLRERLLAYREREVASHTARGEELKAEAVADRVACVLTVLENLPETARTVPALLQRIEGLFADGGDSLTLCTVHRAKGREWDRVAVLEPELMPSKWARQPHQLQEERNLMYVAWTRARHHLILLETEESPR